MRFDVALSYAFVDGIFGIVSAVQAAREGQRWGLLVLEGLVNIGTALSPCCGQELR